MRSYENWAMHWSESLYKWGGMALQPLWFWEARTSKEVLYLLCSHDIPVEVIMWSHQNPLLEAWGMVLCGDTVVWVAFFLKAQSEHSSGWTPGGTALTAGHTVKHFWDRQVEEASVKIKSVIQWVLKTNVPAVNWRGHHVSFDENIKRLKIKAKMLDCTLGTNPLS